MSMSAFWMPVASCETTLMPCARACPRTFWSASGEFGTTVMAVGCCGIRSWMIWICFSGLVSSPPSWRVSTPVRFAKFSSPTAMRSNQAMPLTLTTLTIVMSLGSWAAPPAGALLVPPAPPPTEPQPAISVTDNPTAPRRATGLSRIRHSFVSSRVDTVRYPTCVTVNVTRAAVKQSSARYHTEKGAQSARSRAHWFAKMIGGRRQRPPLVERARPHVTSREYRSSFAGAWVSECQ